MTLEQHLDAAYGHLEAAAKSTELGPPGSVARHLMQLELRRARRALRSVGCFLQMRTDDQAHMDRPYPGAR